MHQLLGSKVTSTGRPNATWPRQRQPAPRWAFHAARKSWALQGCDQVQGQV